MLNFKSHTLLKAMTLLMCGASFIYILMLSSANIAAAMGLTTREENMEFRFEDYESGKGKGQEAAEALLKLHPVSSSVDALVSRLEGLGAKCGPITNPELRDNPRYKNLIFCKYVEKEIIFSTDWNVSIWIKVHNNQNVIDRLEVTSGLNAL